MTADELRARSLDFKLTEVFAAEAEADTALEALADYDAQARHWGEGDSRVMATLHSAARQAEARRHAAKLALLREFAETLALCRRRENPRSPRP